MDHRIPTYRDDTHYYTWSYDPVTRGYSIVCVPISGTYDDRVIVSLVALYTKTRAINYLHGMARRWKLRRVDWVEIQERMVSNATD